MLHTSCHQSMQNYNLFCSYLTSLCSGNICFSCSAKFHHTFCCLSMLRNRCSIVYVVNLGCEKFMWKKILDFQFGRKYWWDSFLVTEFSHIVKKLVGVLNFLVGMQVFFPGGGLGVPEGANFASPPNLTAIPAFWSEPVPQLSFVPENSKNFTLNFWLL